MEDVSDWLTKIIVGIGLVEGQNLARGFGELTQTLNTDLHMRGGTTTVGAVIVYFAVIGFFYGYLSTRLFLAGAFRRADSKGENTPS